MNEKSARHRSYLGGYRKRRRYPAARHNSRTWRLRRRMRIILVSYAVKSKEEWRTILSPDQFCILHNKGTEY
ncbi:hypothetical protein L2E82_11045 [Cichorium intybus]|uniref:Uncharacterized protein n=1 Tax=Cichorium intybus TaxID=13427 RepID=A0ACB9GDG1_CICIN|nr:hypothetical protein L2E82_11045 [Cichorium intybus]